MGFWQDLVGTDKRKPQSVNYEGIKSLKQIPETSESYLPWVKQRYAEGPEYWRDKFYQEAFEPAADRARGEWGEQVRDPIVSEAGGLGMARSSLTIDRLAKELTKRELQLAEFGGELRAKGLETGRQERTGAMGQMGKYITDEASQQNVWAGRQLQAGQANEAAIRAFNLRTEAEPRQMVGQAFETGGNIAAMSMGMPPGVGSMARSAFSGVSRAPMSSGGQGYNPPTGSQMKRLYGLG